MQVQHTTVFALTLLVIVMGCGEGPPLAQPSNSQSDQQYQQLRQIAKTAEEWEAQADVIVETSNVPLGSVRIVRPSESRSTNVVRLQVLDSALQTAGRSLAIVRIPGAPLDLWGATNAVSQLRRCGFGSVRVVAERWGMRFPGPEI